MFRILRIAATGFAALGAAAGLVWLGFFSEALRFRELRIVGNDRASSPALRHLADLPVGAPLLLLDLDDAVAGARRHPWVKSATARRVFPDTVVLTIEERQPQALLLLDALYLVDETGTPFRKADAADLDHPVLTGLPPDLATKDPPLARRIVADALALLQASEGRAGMQRSALSEVRFDARAGYTLVLRNGGEVLLGFQDPPTEDGVPGPAGWDRALARLDTLAGQGVLLSPPVRIDLGLPKLAVVTPL